MADAVKAGQGPAEFFKGMVSSLIFPTFCYFFVWPLVYSSSNSDAPYSSWLWFFIKIWLFMCLLVCALLFLIYSNQEKMLYVPAQPIQYVAMNPAGY